MGPPSHQKKGMASGKSCEMMKASILLQVTLPEKKGFSSPCVSGTLTKRYPSCHKNHGSVENGSLQDQDNRLYKNNQKQPFSTEPWIILRESVFLISSFSDILCKKNIMFFTFCGIWWEVYSSMMMGRRVTSISPANCQGFTSSFKPPAPANASPSLNPLKTSRDVDKRTRESQGGEEKNVRESSTSNIGWINKDIREIAFLSKSIMVFQYVPILLVSMCF